MLDGVDNNETWLQTVVLFPSVDALDEFKLQTSTYSAEFGRSLGGVVNLQIKSGTNAMHGSGFEFLRNDAFDANNFFNNRAGRAEAGVQPAPVRRHDRRADPQGQDVLLLRLSGIPREPGRRPTCRRCRRRRCARATFPSSTGSSTTRSRTCRFRATSSRQADGIRRPKNILNQLIPEPNTGGTRSANGQTINNYLINPTLHAAGQPDRPQGRSHACTAATGSSAATATRRRTGSCRRRCRTAMPGSPSAPAKATSRRRGSPSTTRTRSARAC